MFLMSIIFMYLLFIFMCIFQIFKLKRTDMARKKSGKKRNEMTAEELAIVRKQDRERKQLRRLQLDEEEKERIKAKDRERRAETRAKMENEQKEEIRAIERKRRAEARKKMDKKELDRERINKLIRMRKNRLLQTEENKKIARDKAKEGMLVLRREGPIREYRERTRRHLWTVKWRKFLSQNPMYRELEQKKMKNKEKLE